MLVFESAVFTGGLVFTPAAETVFPSSIQAPVSSTCLPSGVVPDVTSMPMVERSVLK